MSALAASMQAAIQQALAGEQKNSSKKESSLAIKDYPNFKKICCGNAHNFVLREERIPEENGESTLRIKVYGWGKNRYNPLGLVEELKSRAAAHDEDDEDQDDESRTEKWNAFIPYPNDSVFLEQNPFSEDHTRAHVPPDDTEFLEVSAGANHSVILEKVGKETGITAAARLETDSVAKTQLWSWGLQGSGRLGRGMPAGMAQGGDIDADEEYSGPKLIEFPHPALYPEGKVMVQRVACGTDHTLAIANIMGKMDATHPAVQGRVFAWGMGSYGALGLGAKKDAWTPAEVWFPEESAVDCKRTVMIKQVACGSKHSIAVSQDGKVYTWGHGGNGRLGSGVTRTKLGQSFSAEFAPMYLSSLEDTKMEFCTAGEAHTGTIDQLGGLWTWGQGANGRLGHGAITDRVNPKKVENLVGIAIGQVAFGMMHSMAVTVKGHLYGWGKGPATGLDKGDHEFVQIPMPVPLGEGRGDPIYQIACGPMHTVVLLMDGSLYAFGSGSEYRLPSFIDPKRPERKDQAIPKKLPDFKGWVKDSGHRLLTTIAKDQKRQRGPPLLPAVISVGGSNSAVVLNKGELWIWGDSLMAKSTDPPPKEFADQEKDENRPANDPDIWTPGFLRKGLQSTFVRSISIGQLHVLALTRDGRLYAWGDGMSGQLGTGNLEQADTPRLIQNMVDVVHISAGEEHSACIIAGGESYTWGNAEGGRLGLTATMNEGLQMLPAQVVISSMQTDARIEMVPKDMRLRSVTCGNGHTAFISTDDRVLTCGLGWFGRLGQGGNPSPDNAYSPLFVLRPQLRAIEVACANYHTCIIDKDRRLWVCGRDNSICRPAGQHALVPERFAPFEQEPRRYVQLLACADQHTLAVTSLRADAAGGNELWVWGKNSKGQLGMSDIEVPRIETPFLLRLPGVNPKSQRVTKLDTTSWHSMCVVETKKPVPGKNMFEMYAWGYQGGGRLGLSRNEADSVVPYGTVRPPMSNNICLPGKVLTSWRPLKVPELETLAQNDDEQNTAGDNFETLLQKHATSWADIQRLLHAEDADHKEAELLKKAQQVAEDYKAFMTDILSIWDKPPPDLDRRTEFNLRQQQREIESQYLRTLQVMSLHQSIHAPRIENIVKTEKEICLKMHLWEELMWILQQQPLYLCNLAQHLYWSREEPECQVFHRVVGCLYKDLANSRVRNLCKALIRVMVRKEMGHFNSLEELFSPLKSRVANVITQFTINPYWIQSMMKPILDPDDPKSLVYLIIRYTITRDSQKCRTSSRGEKSITAHTTGVFAANQDQFDSMDEKSRAARNLPPRSQEDKAKGRQHFTDELKDFQKLIMGLPSPGMTPVPYDEDAEEYSMGQDEIKERFKDLEFMDQYSWQWMRKIKKGNGGEDFKRRLDEDQTFYREKVMAALGFTKDRQKTLMSFDVKPVKDFLSRFIKVTIADPANEDFQMLMVFILEKLIEQRRYVIQYKSSTGQGWLPELLTPLSAIIMAQMIAGALFAVKTEGHLAMIRVKINEKIDKMEKEFLGSEDDKDPSLADRVWWNIENLGLFFERVVHRQSVYEAQIGESPPSSAKGEEPLVQETARMLNRHVCQVLMEVLEVNKNLDDKPQDDTGPHYSKDDTETQMTVDLYTSHYTMAPTIVTISTADLLLLANYLFTYMEGDPRNPDNVVIHIDKVETDRMAILVDKILPKRTFGEGNKATARTVIWDQGYIAVANLTGEQHNLTMNHRFLEFGRAQTEEVTFCEITQAPIPRSLSTESQKSRSGSRAVKPLRNWRGPELDIPQVGGVCYPYEEVMLLLELLAGSAKGGDNPSPYIKYKIGGEKWSDFLQQVEEIQRQISEAMEEGTSGASYYAELLPRLENGKIFISKIRESTEEPELRAYMEREIKRRYDYNVYLETLKKGVMKIRETQEEYRKKLQSVFEDLQQINEKTAICEIPEEIANAASAHTERLKFMDCKSAKIRKKKKNATPAQQVYEDLLRTVTDVRDPERLKEMVGFPARTFSKSELETKGVLIKLNEKIPNGVQKNMKFTFQYEKEGYTVRIFMQKTLLREFNISRQDIQLMDQARKTAIISYGDDFVRVHCFRLRRLLAFVMAEGGF